MTRVAPQRSCLGCREVKGKEELLRFVLTPERTLIPDPQGKLPGRGAYTCWKRACLEQAVAKRQFSRSFKGEVRSGSSAELAQLVAERLEERIASYLALANKAGKIVSGSDAVLDALRKGTPELLILAADISPESGEKFTAAAARVAVATYFLFTKERLGGLLGKELRSAVAVMHSGFVPSLQQELNRYRNFFEGGA